MDSNKSCEQIRNRSNKVAAVDNVESRDVKGKSGVDNVERDALFTCNCSTRNGHGSGPLDDSEDVALHNNASSDTRNTNFSNHDAVNRDKEFVRQVDDPETSKCTRALKYDDNIPSTSGSSICNTLEYGNVKENRKRPLSLKLNKVNGETEDSSSDTGNDDYSLGSEDGCIYTYRGGEHLADLPSSFFSLDMGLPIEKHLPIPPFAMRPENVNRPGGSHASSPDMDFLEMDFDPGPSCEVDSAGESAPDCDLDIAEIENEVAIVKSDTPELGLDVGRIPDEPSPEPVISKTVEYDRAVPSTSSGIVASDEGSSKSVHIYGPFITHINSKGERLLVRRTMATCHGGLHPKIHRSSGDLVSPKELSHSEEEELNSHFGHQINQDDSYSLPTSLFHLTMAKKLMMERCKADLLQNSETCNAPCETENREADNSIAVEVPRSMIWSEQEACDRQVTQIGTSACGATAVVNVFLALGIPIDLDRINLAVGTRQRANNAPLPRYLLSRSVAGCTAADLVTGIQRASDGLVTARFFHTYPERAVSISHWLADWISLGAVPIATLNLQAGCSGCESDPEMADAWHHQMVFGVSPRGVYLCNPASCVRESWLWTRLVSPSVLMVRARDVLSRFTQRTDLSPLLAIPDTRFRVFNVLGQVVNLIRENRAVTSEGVTRTSYIRIPASYQAGFTISALTGTEAHKRLIHATQLPIIAHH